jgi:hypothetical protein
VYGCTGGDLVIFNQRIMKKDGDARETGNTRGTHGILTAVDWCFGILLENEENLTQGGRGGQRSGWLASSRSRDVSF